MDLSAPLFWVLASLCLLIGLSAASHIRRLRDSRLRRRSAKWAMAGFGSAAIVLLVMLIHELLPILVVGSLIIWFARQIWLGRSPVLRFLEEKIAQSGY